jgi:hypothetical protein
MKHIQPRPAVRVTGALPRRAASSREAPLFHRGLGHGGEGMPTRTDPLNGVTFCMVSLQKKKKASYTIV